MDFDLIFFFLQYLTNDFDSVFCFPGEGATCQGPERHQRSLRAAVFAARQEAEARDQDKAAHSAPKVA